MSLFTFGIELWRGASYTKYILSQIDKFVNRAFRNGYVKHFKEVISERDKKLWSKILNNKKSLEYIDNMLNRTLRQIEL
jgi:Zn-finger domain-containing protein